MPKFGQKRFFLQDRGFSDFDFSAAAVCAANEMRHYFIYFLMAFSKTKPRSLARYTFSKERQPTNKAWSSLAEGHEGCIGPSGKLLCFWPTEKDYAAYAWQYSKHFWLLGQSSCSPPSTNELLHAQGQTHFHCEKGTDIKNLFYCFNQNYFFFSFRHLTFGWNDSLNANTSSKPTRTHSIK